MSKRVGSCQCSALWRSMPSPCPRICPMQTRACTCTSSNQYNSEPCTLRVSLRDDDVVHVVLRDLVRAAVGCHYHALHQQRVTTDPAQLALPGRVFVPATQKLLHNPTAGSASAYQLTLTARLKRCPVRAAPYSLLCHLPCKGGGGGQQPHAHAHARTCTSSSVTVGG